MNKMESGQNNQREGGKKKEEGGIKLLTLWQEPCKRYVVVPTTWIPLVRKFSVWNTNPRVQNHDIVVDAVREERKKNRIKDII